MLLLDYTILYDNLYCCTNKWNYEIEYSYRIIVDMNSVHVNLTIWGRIKYIVSSTWMRMTRCHIKRIEYFLNASFIKLLNISNIILYRQYLCSSRLVNMKMILMVLIYIRRLLFGFFTLEIIITYIALRAKIKIREILRY